MTIILKYIVSSFFTVNKPHYLVSVPRFSCGLKVNVYAQVSFDMSAAWQLIYSRVISRSSPSSFIPELMSNVLTTPARGDCTTISIFMADRTTNG